MQSVLCLLIGIILTFQVRPALVDECISKNGKTCIKKSDLKANFNRHFIGGDPCFVMNETRRCFVATEGAGMLAPCTCKAECGCSDKIPALPKCDNSVVPKNPDCTAHKNIFCKLDYHGLKNTRCIYCGVDMTACYKVCERTLSEADIKVIVYTHNQVRRKVAKGLETRGVGGGQPKAADMFELAWDPVLADSAQRWADQCPERQPHPHDENRLIPGFSDVGQNIGTTWSRDNSPVRDLARKIEVWYEEVVGWPAAKLLRFDRTGIEKDIRHYTQLIWGATTRIGCGYISYIDLKNPNAKYMQTLVCNYAAGGNVLASKVYTPTSGMPGSGCPMGTNDGLCRWS